MNAPANLPASKRALLEKMLRGDAAAPSAEMPAPIRPRAPGTPLPLSAEQRQVWHHAALAADVPLYNEACTLYRTGPYDHQAMTRAVQELVRRHEAFRTSFVEVDGIVQQHVVDTLAIDMPFDDVSHLPEPERDAAAAALGTADVCRLFALDAAPLMRVRAVRIAPDRHRIYIAFHHIAFDGVALYRVILPELAAMHDAFARGAPSPLTAPPLQYGDYTLWQPDHLASPAIRRQLDYWRSALAGAPAPLELPGDRPRPRVQTHAGDQHVFRIARALTERLRALARDHGVTLYMALLASYHALLHRYTGEEDIIVGGVTDLRRRPELERVIGYSLNAMALRTRPRADLPFTDLLAQARDAALGALAASEVPFDEVVQAVGVRRAPGRQPLFNCFFSIQPPLDHAPEGWQLGQMDLSVGGAKYDLYLELEDRPDGLEARFLYSTELFDAATIERLTGHWLTLLAGIADQPGQAIGALPLLTAAEDRQLTAAWNDTARPLPAAMLPEQIAEAIAARPDATAIRWNGGRFSYAALDTCADAVAAALEAAGIGPGALVGICLDRTPDMVAALLAVHRVGAAYLPLDPDFPPARLAYIVESAGPAVLLGERARLGALPDAGVPVIVLDDLAPGRPTGRVTAAPDDLAYVLYTSGSTGKPKGVEITHGALANLLASMRRQPGMAAGEALLAITTLSFDIAGLELFLPLIAGGEVILAHRDTAVDPRRLAEAIATEQPDVMQATPATWRALVEAGWAGDPRLRILCGGEALPRDLADALLARCGELWNVYGPTETTIWSTCARVTAGVGPVPIGRPIDNTGIHILDPQGRRVPIGVVGELHIGGAGLARGYRGRPDLTAERFGPRLATGDERLYRTGDLARYRPDGSILCLGRVDNDEKIRGYRVAVEEIEGALCEHPSVAAAAVRSWPDASGERALAAYVVCPAELDREALRRHIAERLPAYMVPSWIEALDALPMTPNAKIDRKALPEPGAGAPRAMAAPEGETEQRLAAIWRELLGVAEVSRDDNFFALGGHSLLVARLLMRIEKDWGQRLGMGEFFRADTLAALASRVDRGADDGLGLLVPLQAEGSRTPIVWIDGGPRFRALALATGTDRPFLGLPTAEVLDAGLVEGMSIERVAGQLVDAIRQSRPRGPYIIGGWCTFGIVAFEVARQMRAAGDDVRMLVLGHAINPVAYHAIGATNLRLSKVRYHWGMWRRLPLRDRWRYALDRFHGVMEETGIADAAIAEDHGRDRTAALENAALLYEPQPYDGDVAIFQPIDRLDVWDTVPGWCAVATGAVHAFDVPGDHGTITDPPGARVWAGQLNGVLAGL